MTLRERFLAFCREQSKYVASAGQHWIEGEDGESDYASYCYDCAAKKVNGPKDRVCGGGSVEEDSQRWCSDCGIILEVSLLDNGIDDECGLLAKADALCAEECWVIARFLDGHGCFDESKHWPLIAPHAERLMKASEVTA